jgi:hypothetical protein
MCTRLVLEHEWFISKGTVTGAFLIQMMAWRISANKVQLFSVLLMPKQ